MDALCHRMLIAPWAFMTVGVASAEAIDAKPGISECCAGFWVLMLCVPSAFLQSSII
jgi:hypothetical protein